MGTHSSTTTNNMQSLLVLTCLTAASAAPGHHGHSSSAMGRGSFQRLALAPAAPSKNIAELAIATPQLSTLLAAVKAAGLVDTLASEGPLTVFAPTNSAFEKVPADALNALLGDKDALTAVLLRHVVSGSALAAKDIPRGSTAVATAGGEEITVTKDRAVKITSSAGS